MNMLNMSEFIESIQLSIEDAKNIGLEGQTEGMSKLFINKLQGLDIVVRRPVLIYHSVAASIFNIGTAYISSFRSNKNSFECYLSRSSTVLSRS